MPEASSSTPSVQLVVAYEFSPSAECALLRAIEVVVRAPFHVLHVVHASESGTYDDAEATRALIVARITTAFAGRASAADVQVYVHARLGKPVDEILAVAREVSADLVFVGSHGTTGIKRLVIGSVSERIVREAGCPVMVARGKTYAPVELVKVYPYEHARTPHNEVRAFSYVNHQIQAVAHPPEWP